MGTFMLGAAICGIIMIVANIISFFIFNFSESIQKKVAEYEKYCEYNEFENNIGRKNQIRMVTQLVTLVLVVVIGMIYTTVIGTYGDVTKVIYKIEPINNSEYNVYFTDGKYYYDVKKIEENQNDTCLMYLKKSRKAKHAGYKINLDEKYRGYFIVDLKGHKELIFRNDNYKSK